MSNSTATVSSAIEGGTVTITYETDPSVSDGLTQEEIVTSVVGLVPALVYAATYGRFNADESARTLREFASLWQPAEVPEYVSTRTLMDKEDTFIEVQRGPASDYVYYESEH